MMNKTLGVAVLAGLMLTGCRVMVVEPGGDVWELLGVRTVNLGGDHDKILAGLQGTFRAIRIDVKRTEIELYDIRVNFGDGDHWAPNLRHHFKEGTWSRVIDLPGRARVIRSIDFWYRTRHPGEGRAVVEVWGLH